MPSKARWADLYRSKVSPKVGDLIFAYHRGVHRVLNVREVYDSDFSNKRLVTYVQVADRRFNQIVCSNRTQTCDILWTMPFEETVRKSNFVDPEFIIQKVQSYL